MNEHFFVPNSKLAILHENPDLGPSLNVKLLFRLLINCLPYLFTKLFSWCGFIARVFLLLTMQYVESLLGAQAKSCSSDVSILRRVAAWECISRWTVVLPNIGKNKNSWHKLQVSIKIVLPSIQYYSVHVFEFPRLQKGWMNWVPSPHHKSLIRKTKTWACFMLASKYYCR